jgi:hypothetical protein
MTVLLSGLPPRLARLLAWLLLIAPALISLVFASVLIKQALATRDQVASLGIERVRLEQSLAEAVRAEQGWMIANGVGTDRLAILADAARAREAFDARYGAFLSALEAAGIETALATGVGDTPVNERIGELHGSWAGAANFAAVLAILDQDSFQSLRVSELTVRSVGDDGLADIFLEFRQPYLLEQAR